MTRVYSREEVRAIPIRARRVPGSVVHGEIKTRVRGLRGLEISDFREYAPGDDVGRIDWNVTARLGKPWVRTYLQERGHPVLLMVDVSSSTYCGAGNLPTQAVISEVAARLGSAAIWSGCETGLLLFADRVKKYIPGAAGMPQLASIVRELKCTLPDEGETNVASALDYAQTAVRRRSLIFLLSDFLCGDFAASLQRCAGRHEVIAIGVSDSSAAGDIPACGLVNLRDPETGVLWQLDTASQQARSAFDGMKRMRLVRNADAFKKSGVDCLQLHTDLDYAGSLTAFLRRRAG